MGKVQSKLAREEEKNKPKPVRRALLVGINYRGTSHALHGCINDVMNVKKMLMEHYDYKEEDIEVLTDDTRFRPTRHNVMCALRRLIWSGAKQLFFHYSGHGTQVWDSDGDESDGRDEAIVCLDRIIKDDELAHVLQSMSAEQRLTAVMDCCHSGTALDLRYNLRRQGRHQYGLKISPKERSTPGTVVMLSGCLDRQTSADAWEERQSQGALTYALRRALREGGHKSCKDLTLLKRIHKILKKNGYKQVPQLSYGRGEQLHGSCFLAR